MNHHQNHSLRFNGSLWCNLEIARRRLDQIYIQSVEPLGLTVIEWYILQALYEQDGIHASELAHAVGRAATSFTPTLDRLQEKGLILRQPDRSDRRAVHIFLTEKGWELYHQVLETERQIQQKLGSLFERTDYMTFLHVLTQLQGSMAESTSR